MNHLHKKGVVILDFGSQYTQLIARRVREHNVYSKIVAPGTTLDEILKHDPAAIILSGGPSSIYEKNAPDFDFNIINSELPILGICYGLQLITKIYGGSIKSSHGRREFGKAKIIKKRNSLILKNFFKDRNNEVWMSHQDAVSKMPKNFINIASTFNSKFTAIQHKTKK